MAAASGFLIMEANTAELSRQAVADLNAEQSAQVLDLVRQFRLLSRELGITPLI